MDGDGDDAAHDRLLELLEERHRPVPAAQRHELDAEIAAAAGVLGLEASELDALAPEVVEAQRLPPRLVGRFRIMRQMRNIMPFLIGVILMPMVFGLGQPVAATAGLVLVVVGWLVHSRRRAAVFEIDQAGRMEFRNHGPVDWADVDGATFRYRYPWASVPGSLSRAAAETAVIRIHRRGRRPLRLAQGQLFQIKPTRQPISYHRFGRFLREQATAAGMKVTPVPDKKGAWTGSRST